MEKSRSKEKLKEIVIDYLLECPGQKCKIENFWNQIAQYKNIQLSRKEYGVRKMDNLFHKFDDVLFCTDKLVGLRNNWIERLGKKSGSKSKPAIQGKCHQNVNNSEPSHSNASESIVISDSDSDGDSYESSSSYQSSTGVNVSQDSNMSWGSGAADVSFQSARLPPQSNNLSSGFLSFSSNTASGSKSKSKQQSQPPHVRYGNSPSETPRTLPPSLRNDKAMASFQPGPSCSQDNVAATFQSTRPGAHQMVRNMPVQQGSSHSDIPQLLPSALGTPGQMLPGTMPGFASPALLTPTRGPSVRNTQTEWPKPRARNGPPPGTKMPDPPRDATVKSFSLPRGARLSAEQVNFEINDCIDFLSGMNEHVSLERIEELLLRKFKVSNFRALNLQQRYITQLDAANEHSRLLSKVNAYFQNFARSRSLCTLYEMRECCREYHKHQEEFEKLRLGPLQKMPVVFDLFKFPMDEYVPEITSVDLLEHLNDFLTQQNKWTVQVHLEEFLTHLEKVYEVQNSFSLGIRLRSVPLAIMTLKKSQRDAGKDRKKVQEEMMSFLHRDIVDAFSRYRESLLQTSDGSGSHQLRLHYASLSPCNAINEIFQKYLLLAGVMVSDLTSSKAKKIERFMRCFESFVKHLFEDSFPQLLFHLAVSMSNSDVQQTANEFMEQQKQQSSLKAQKEATKDERQPPAKNVLTEKILHYLNKCLERGALQLSHLKSIEEKVLEDFNFSSFHELIHTTFLEFLLSDKKFKQVLEECGGTLLGSSSALHESSGSVIASQRDLVDLIFQSRDAGVIQNEQLAQAICEQYHVAEVRALGHGNISRLCQTADRVGKIVRRHPNCVFEAAVCGKACPSTQQRSVNVGLQGNQTRESAIACLTACPVLEDMSEWSQWPLIFQPQHGPLRDFISKHGGVQFHSIDGGKRTATSDFAALETEPGKFLKLSAQTTQTHFISALESENPLLAAGHLVSLIVANKGIESTPLALLTTHVKAKLHSLHARMSTPGGPPHLGSTDMIDPAVQFITAMLLRLPLRIGIAVANQVLLEPLSQVVGSSKSKLCIAQACTSPAQGLKLEQLGCLLGVQEWKMSMASRMAFPAHLIQENLEDDSLDQHNISDDDGEEEEESRVEDDDDDSSEEAEIELILSESVDSGTKGEDETPETVGDDANQKGDKGKDVSPRTCQHEDEQESEEGESDTSDESDSTDGDDDDEEDEAETEKGNTAKVHMKESKPQERTMSFAENDDGVVDELKEKDGETVVEVEKELTREEECQKIIDLIRQKEFGVGIELTDEIRDLMLKQQERQGRSLERLSRELYSKDTHFVLELIQNADDNHYDEDVVPSIKFVIDAKGLTVNNNEQGFEEKNIRALCDVGKSTKSKHNLGYIGQKGIGFKSVFRVTGRPEVHSNGYHMYFDVSSGPMGYILPHWSDVWDTNPSWQTQIVLPWTAEIVNQIITHAARFNDIKPSLLLFLHRLKQITIVNQVENNQLYMEREDLDKGQVQISHTHGKDRWLVVRKRLDANKVSLQAKSGVEVQSTEIALAFPINKKEFILSGRAKLEHLPVFAFLPLRDYGFKFIIQGDFDVPSSREDVDRDSTWNQWLRTEIPSLFLDAWDSFQALPNLSPIEALITYLQFVPMDGEVTDFFKPISHHILSQLRAKEFLPVLGASGEILWKMPSKTIISRDTLVREIISPELLKHLLELYFLHDDVANVLDSAQVEALGVEKITTENLILIGQSVTINWNSQDNADQVMDIAKWMACVYRSLDDFRDNTELIEKLCSLKIVPLSSGCLVTVQDVTVFLLREEQQNVTPKHNRGNRAVRDPFLELKSDLNLVHTGLTSTSDMEINSQVVKLLMKMGVKQMTPHDLIHSHIMPILESGQWKKKEPKVLVSYMVYIKSEMDKKPGILDFEQLRPVAPVLTNHGIKVPAQENVHFSKAFGNSVDLQRTFPSMKWSLVDGSYLSATSSPLDVQTWHTFLSTLGVNDFLCVRKEEVQLEPDKLRSSAWSAYESLWPPSMDGYILHDFCCDEFYQLATQSNPSPDVMKNLYLYLDKMWDSVYKGFRFTQLLSGSGEVLKDTIETSFFIHLKNLPWVPARWVSVDIVEAANERPIGVSHTGCRPPHQLYTPRQDIVALLGDTVEFLDVHVPDGNSSFTLTIQVKCEVRKEAVQKALISWGEREATKATTPKRFITKMKHILSVYDYLSNELSGKESQDLFHDHPVFFIPLCHADINNTVAGHMMKREEVCWLDDTGLFTKHHKSLTVYQSPLATFKFMQPFYKRYEEIFQQARLKTTPDVLDCSELLKHITVLSLLEEDTLSDALMLMTRIGSDLSLKDQVQAGVATNEAILAQAKIEKVKNLLTPCSVFPTKGAKWVGLADRPMIPDSVELEQLFTGKPGVHFVQSELNSSQQHRASSSASRKSRPFNKHGEDRSLGIDADDIGLYLSLFEDLKPLSECIKTSVITPGFQPCYKGQKYMHNVTPLLQQFLYFVFPDVYDLVKMHKADLFKELQFIQVNKLEVKYELTERPDIYEIKEDKCFVDDKMFYFHEKYVDEDAEIHREVAKYLSLGNEECCRELRNFLSQAVAILDGKSTESMEDLLSRQRQQIHDLPEEEWVWEVPLPIAPLMPEPELFVDAMEVAPDEDMVYGRGLSVPGSEMQGNEAGGSNSDVMKSWPPRSHVDVPAASGKSDSVKNDKTSGRRAPPEAPDYVKTSRQLPSYIQFENEPQTVDKANDENSKSKEKKDGETDKKERPARDSTSDFSRQNSQNSQSRGPGSRLGDDDLRQHVVTISDRGEDRGPLPPGSHETGKRKWRDGSESDQEIVMSVKRLNSSEEISSQQATKTTELTEGQGMTEDSAESSKENQTEPGDPTDGHSASTDLARMEDHRLHPKKNKYLRFSIPLWSDHMEDLKFTEVASGADLVAQQHKPLPENSMMTEIGRWGEALVHNYLLKQMDTNCTILDVIWANQGEETGLPYDIEIMFKTENDTEQYSVFVDVKATVSEDKAVFEISPRQVEYAMHHKERYQIFRVFGAGTNNIRMVRIDNIADRMLTKSLKLFMTI